MIHQKLLLMLALVSLLPACSQAGNEGYQIGVTIQGLQDEECYLGYHFGDRQYLADTARADQNGYMLFEGKQRLTPGIYFVILPDQQYFEFIIDKDQHFSLQTDLNDLAAHMVFTGSPENDGFYDILRFISANNKVRETSIEQLNDPGTTDEERFALQQELQRLEKAMKEKQDKYIKKFPEALFSAVILAQREPQVDDIFREDGSPHQEAMFQQFVNQYWDYVDFSDDRLLQTPVFHGMLNRYFNQLVRQFPDTVIAKADQLVEKARANDEMFKYVIWYVTNNSERSQVMGMDAVFVHMVENYYMTGEAFWVSPENRERIAQRAKALKPLLIGKKAPDVTMFTPDKKKISLHEVEARFLVLYFWDSECNFCAQETPALKKLHEQAKDKGMKVFAVNTEYDEDKWIKALDRYQIYGWINVNDTANHSGYQDIYDIYAIPLIYLLDEDKKIIAKQITVEQLTGFMAAQP
jgi:thiol-disulfide isomerase/thioredoxin